MKTSKRSGLLFGALALVLTATTALGTTAFAASTTSKSSNPQQQANPVAVMAQPTSASATTDSPTKDTIATATGDTGQVNGTKLDKDVEQPEGAESQNEVQDQGKEAAENAALAAKATVTEQEAIQIAQNANPGYTFVVDELGDENGVIVYELKGKDASGKVLEVHVDAGSGALIQESDSEHDD